MIWILLPAYNEEASLPKLLPRLVSVLDTCQDDYRIVVVNDGSHDNTGALLTAYQAQYALEVLTHDINRGLGETERDGFEYIALNATQEDVIIRMDCDDTHNPEYIPQIIDTLRTHEVVITSRFRKGGGQKGVNRYRTFISYGASLFMKLLFNIPGVRDYSCGYRGYRVQVIQDALRVYGNNFIQLRGLGFTSTLEMIVKLHMLGARITEIPFVLRYDLKESASKMSSAITIFGYLVMAVLHHYPVRGWRTQYRGLNRQYRQDAPSAIAAYQLKALAPETHKRLTF